MDQERIEQLEKRVQQLEREILLLKNEPLNQEGKAEPLHEGIKKKENKYPLLEDAEALPRNSGQIQNHGLNSGTKPKSQESRDWEYEIGRVWLPRIFIFVLFIGIIWGFKVVVDYGILTEPVRVVLGFVVALLLYFIGERQMKAKREGLGKTLLVGAVGVLILTTFAMHILYSMIPTYPAFILNLTWISIGLFLSHHHKSEVMAILIAIIGYLIPFLVFGTATILVPVVYVILFYAALVYFAINKGYKVLFYVTTSLLHFVYFAFVISAIMFDVDRMLQVMAVGAVIQQLLIFYAVYLRKFQKMYPIPLLFTSFVVTTFWVKMGTLQADYFYLVYLIFISVAFAVLFYLQRHTTDLQKREFTSVSIAITTFALFLLILEAFQYEGNTLTIVFLIQGLIALYLGARYQFIFQQVMGGFIYFVGVMLVLQTAIFKMVSFETLIWFFFIASLYGLVYLSKKFYQQKAEVQISVLFASIVGHLLLMFSLPPYDVIWSFSFITFVATAGSLLGLYFWTRNTYQQNQAVLIVMGAVNVIVHLVILSDFVRMLTNGLTDGNISMMSLSFAWALYAAGSIIIGVVYDKKVFRLLGLGLLFLTLLKVIFIDLYYLTIMIRAVLFIGLGMIGILLSRLFYVKKEKEEHEHIG
ncbi:hypothetical protein AJ85_17490 [Alkalihalobacillus alcalophilus ATCC 27647 = CGMCC 1.3604]|uniref:DUF2339 domain-containing protein n=1 Tax=Alkalihalobacillus alcalophilus ATCC 27647 = CGMCC 1.3604 TaxID=1218173 RepID=A0A094WJK6_ALKAL|nr:DUF2339 domain-containing protein [Alkalihalobacillus alcalophilus]KGA96128.1 hypothetical protein BALCAV_0218235 [Alkalihalobacillus alcalophilus ATCC 27647 = CGMCC 1.3604]MED1564319.1 DUF2339 domain-containing protein [Alkalihalobacillus alcalophilus]THG92080.1 hypothetical protein AJ85_17490 [Alkalihalobacillus alcalophilus ATCC 27647 = CGMCC 1.3604]